MVPDSPDDVSPPPLPPGPVSRTEQEMREAEDLALLASGLGSGLLRRQPLPEADDSVAVLKVCPQCGTEYETAARFCPADGTGLRPKGSDSLIDRVLAERYHILKRIGEGGMGRVYLGEHVKMNRQCAIKVMNPALVNDHESATRFAREASSAARIIHPNVAAVFDFGESEGLVYLVMEYVDGEPLSRLLAREAPLSVERAVDIARQIADGLGAAHELGIVHRDLKPDNILIARSRGGKEIAKVVDFGIAKAMQETVGEALTRTGLVIGTPEFMSPEQLLGDPIDARSDLYAVGCILYLMLTAVPPFEAATREQMIKRRLAEDAPHIRAVNPALPDSLDRIVQRLLARNPAERYGSAVEVRDALDGGQMRPSVVPVVIAGVHTPVPSQPTPRSAPTIAFDSLQNATTQVTPAHSAPVLAGAGAPPSRRPALVAGGAVALSAALVIAVYAAQAGPAEGTAAPARRDTMQLAASTPALPGVTPAGAGTAVNPSPRDSARRKAALAAAAARAARDSTARAEAGVRDREVERAKRAKRDSVRASESRVPLTVRAIMNSYVRAIESRDMGQLKASYAGVSEAQERTWSGYFATYESIDASITYGEPALLPTALAPTSIDAPFTLRLQFVRKDTKETSTSRTSHHAIFTKAGDRWVLQRIN